MPSFQETLMQLAALKHQKTVFDEVVNFLQQFMEDEVHKPDRSMTTNDLGDVPQNVLQLALHTIQEEHIDVLQKAIALIENMKVEASNGKAASVEKEGASKGRPQEGSGKAGQQGKKAALSIKGKRPAPAKHREDAGGALAESAGTGEE